MTETTNETASEAGTDTGTETGGIEPSPMARLMAHFIVDLSFENVAISQGNLVAKGQPEIKVNVGMDAKNIKDNRYQVNLKVNAKAESGEETRFIAEMDYAGVFDLDNVKKEHVHPFLFIECQRQLLPFARRVLADVTRDGGYPPLMLDNIDFAALYRQRLQEARARQAAEGGKTEAGAEA